MTIIRPRLTDFHGIYVAQSSVDFAIPFVDEDIPLYLDPFLLWKSPAFIDQSLHTTIVISIESLARSYTKNRSKTIESLIFLSECDEIGLGSSKTRQGNRIGANLAENILSFVADFSQGSSAGIQHIEVLQIMIPGVGPDRISDIASNIIKSWLIDYSIHQAKSIGIPLSKHAIDVFNPKTLLLQNELVDCIVNPITGKPILLVPKRWLRRHLWIEDDDYFQYSQSQSDAEPKANKAEFMDYSRHHAHLLEKYINYKERTSENCSNDPLFTSIPVSSAKRKLAELKRLPSGTESKADKKYEQIIVQLLASMLYPELDFAAEQVRSDSGTTIRDMLFYNTRSIGFLSDIFQDYECKQLVFEMKNVRNIEREHINQVNRYLSPHIGKFGVLVTRHHLPRAMQQNIVDLWSGQRKCILCLTDEDIELMVNVFESKQRKPIEILQARFLEFSRKLPS